MGTWEILHIQKVHIVQRLIPIFIKFGRVCFKDAIQKIFILKSHHTSVVLYAKSGTISKILHTFMILLHIEKMVGIWIRIFLSKEIEYIHQKHV